MNKETAFGNIMNKNSFQKDIIRSQVKGTYDLQKLRVSGGNRLAANFKHKLGQAPGTKEEDMDNKQALKCVKTLREEYKRITDGIVTKRDLPSIKQFEKVENGVLISSYSELILVHNYEALLAAEELGFKGLEAVLSGEPVYEGFLKNISGIGPAGAGVLISEIDIEKAMYPSSLWKYAGIDTHQAAFYVNEKGAEVSIPSWEIMALYDEFCEYHGHYNADNLLYNGKYPINFRTVGRTRQGNSLVMREYKSKDGDSEIRKSITFNPFLKTKLLGIIVPSFLKVSATFVDGVKMGHEARLELAKSEGFVFQKKPKKDKKAVEVVVAEDDEEDKIHGLATQVMGFLSQHHTVVVERSPYANIYYNYKHRLENMPVHKEKSALHIHNMAIRYVAKQFLADYYEAARAIHGLPVAKRYEEAKLGLTHGQLSEGKLKSA